MDKVHKPAYTFSFLGIVNHQACFSSRLNGRDGLLVAQNSIVRGQVLRVQ